MERLTRRSANGTGVYATPSGEPIEWENNRHNVLQKLADYEDLEEQGRLIKLSCNVGDKVFAESDCFGILEYEVDEIIIEKSITYRCSAYSEPIGDYSSECLDEIEPDILDFGKTVFLTRGEAEAKLKELRGNNE